MSRLAEACTHYGYTHHAYAYYGFTHYAPNLEQGDVEIDDEGTSAVRQLASRIRKKKGVVKATAWTKRANNHSRMKGSVDAKKRSVGQVSLTPGT